MTPPVHYIAYASKLALTSGFSDSIFLDIQDVSIRNNTNAGITGFLLFKEGKFFQYFEGDELVCIQLLNALKRDRRHTNLTILAQGTIEQRLFNDWAMSCFNLNEKTQPLQLSDQLNGFDIFNWQTADVQKAITGLADHYFHHFKPEEVSYLKLLLRKAIRQNRLLLLVNLTLSVCIFLAMLSLIFLK